MINCVSDMVPPARSNRTGTQLVHVMRRKHRILSKPIPIFTTISAVVFAEITHFTNRSMQRRQSTVVSLMGSIQRCILGTTGRIFHTPAGENTCSDRITHIQKNERCNIHDNLAQVRKSEKSLQYSDGYAVIEASMCENCDDYNYNFYQTFGKSDHTTSTHMTYGRDYYSSMTSGIIAQMDFNSLCAHFSFIHAEEFFIN